MEQGLFEIESLLYSDRLGSVHHLLCEVIEEGKGEELVKEAKALLKRIDRLFPEK